MEINEIVKKDFPRISPKEFEELIILQKYFAHLKERDIDEAAKFIFSSNFSKTEDGFIALLENFCIFTRIRPLKIPLYAKLCKNLFVKTDDSSPPLAERRLELLALFFEPSCLCSPVVRQIYFFRFLHSLYLEGVFSLTEFIEEYSRNQDLLLIYDNYLVFLLLWFAPEISKEGSYRDTMMTIFQKYANKKEHPKPLAQYLSNLNETSKDNFATISYLVENGCEPGSLLSIMKADDFKAYKQYCERNPELSQETLVEYNLFMDGPSFGQEMFQIQMAALYKAVRIFKGIILSGCNIEPSAIIPYVIAGGSMELFRYVIFEATDQEIDRSSILQLSASFQRNDIFRYEFAKHTYDINKVDNFESTVLHQCSESCNIEVMLMAIQAGADVNIRDSTDITPFAMAAERGRYTSARILMAHPMIKTNSRDGDGETPLFYAASYGYHHIVRLIRLEGGFNPNIRNISLHTPLHKAALQVNPKCMFEMLSFEGIDVNAKDSSKQTPLHFSARGPERGIMAALLAYPGIEINPKNSNGQTPLNVACECNNAGGIKILLEQKNIDVNNIDDAGESPLHSVASASHVEGAKLLLAHPRIHVNTKNKIGLTPLHIAVSLGCQDLVKMLIQHPKIDTQVRMRNGKTALDLALELKNKDIIKLLRRY